MRPALVVAVLLSCLALSAFPARGEVMVGGFLVGDPGTHPLSQFGSLAQGSMAPNRQIAGPDTQLKEPHFGTLESNQQLIYISDFRGEAIQVFPAFASGNVAPLRTIKSPHLGQPRGHAPVVAHSELGVIASGCCIYTFPLDANGTGIWPIRMLSWGGNSPTELNYPRSLIYLPATDEFAVLDNSLSPPNASHILFFPRTATGGTAPSRRITGVNVSEAVSMAYDPVGGRIFVLRRLAGQGSTFDGRIEVFNELASGNAVPAATIMGPNTQLQVTSPDYFVGMGYDRYRNTLMVSSTREGSPASNKVVVLDASGNGNVTPSQILQGTNLSPRTVGTPFGMTTNVPPVLPFVAIATPTQISYGETSTLSSYGGLAAGAVTYEVTAGAGVCSIQNNTLTAIDVGTCTVTATKAGNPSPASVNLTVLRAQQAPLTLFVSPETLVVGQASVLSTQGGTGAGEVYFYIQSGDEVCSVQGSGLVALAPGTCVVRSYKLGNEHYDPISSQAVEVVVHATINLFADGFEAP